MLYYLGLSELILSLIYLVTGFSIIFASKEYHNQGLGFGFIISGFFGLLVLLSFSFYSCI